MYALLIVGEVEIFDDRRAIPSSLNGLVFDNTSSRWGLAGEPSCTQTTISSSSTQLIYRDTGFIYKKFDNYQILQEFYDQIFPGLSAVDIQFDVYDVNVVQPLSLVLENMIVDISKTGNYTASLYDKVQPVLRTVMPHHRPNTETLLAMVKRNLYVPEIQGTVDPKRCYRT